MKKSGRKALTPDQLDNLGLALMEMAKELWVVKDRQIITEALLREKNLLGDLEVYQPGPELKDHLAVERERFLGALTAALFGADEGHDESKG